MTQGEFGEGTAVVSVGGEQRVVQLTYQNGTAYQYQLSALLNSSDEFDTSAADRREEVYTYPPFVKEGWGLAAWPASGVVYMSDGTNTLHVLRASNFRYIHSLPVLFPRTRPQSLTDQSIATPLSLNELELLSPDVLLANLYPTRCLALVNLTSARLLSVIQADDGTHQLYHSRYPALEVMNGIAYRPANGSTDDMLLVTGKLWPAVYQVRIVERSQQLQGRVELVDDSSDEEQMREACPVPEWTSAEAAHAKVVVSAIQRGWTK